MDTGSRDRSGAVLSELIGQDAVFGMERSTGYGEAVSVALRHATRRRSGQTDPNLTRVEWIWLLHDDCEPGPAGARAAAAGGQQGPFGRGARAQGARRPGPADAARGGRLHRPGGPPDHGHRAGRDRPGPARPQQGRARRRLGGHARPARRVGSARRVRLAAAAVPRRPRLLLAGAGGRLPGAGRHRRGALPPGAVGQAAPADRGRRRAQARPAQRALRARRQPSAAGHAPHRRRGRDRLDHQGRLLRRDQAARHGAGAGGGGRLAVPAPGSALAGPPSARRRARGRLCRGPYLHPARAHALAARGEGRGADIGRPAAGVGRAAPGVLGRIGRGRAVRRHAVRHAQDHRQPRRPAVRGAARRRADRRAAAARHQPAWRRRAGARLGRFRRAVGGVPRGLPRGRRRIDRVRPAVPGGRGGPGARSSAARPGWRWTCCCSAACRWPG